MPSFAPWLAHVLQSSELEVPARRLCRMLNPNCTLQVHRSSVNVNGDHFYDILRGFENGFVENKNDGYGEGCEIDV